MSRIGCTWLRAAGMVLVGVLLGAEAPALMLSTFAGDAADVRIDLRVVDGDALLVVEVVSGRADIRGIFFDVADDAMLAGLSVIGPDVTEVVLGSAIDLGDGADLFGAGSPCPCDVGVEIGGPGLMGGLDDHLATKLVIRHATLDLDPSFFAGQVIGVRLDGVGPDAGDRSGSAQLGGVIPEPSTGALALFGLLLLAGDRRSLAARVRAVPGVRTPRNGLSPGDSEPLTRTGSRDH